MVCRRACMSQMKTSIVDGMLFGLVLGALYGAYQVYRSDEPPDSQKAATDIADWSIHVSAVCALLGAFVAIAKGS